MIVNIEADERTMLEALENLSEMMKDVGTPKPQQAFPIPTKYLYHDLLKLEGGESSLTQTQE